MILGTVYTFMSVEECLVLEIIYNHCIFNIDLTLCVILSFVAAPPTLDKTMFCIVNQCTFVMISSLSHFIPTDKTVFLLLAISGSTTIVFVFSCNFDLSILFMLLTTSFLLDLWLGETVLIIFQTFLWIGVLGWVSMDRRSEVSSIPEDFETIEMN